MATVVKNIFPSTLFNTSSPQVALDQTAPMSFYVVLLNFFARFFFSHYQPAAFAEAFANNDNINLCIW